MSDLLQTMWTCPEQATFFFTAGNPGSQKSFARRAAWLRTEEYDRSRLAEVLYREHLRLKAGAETLNNIKKLSEGDTLVVVTGQQAGMLTGPLYTLYKAITAIRLAKEQSVKLGCAVVPVFWVAGEDHDWAEIQTAWFLDRHGKPTSCTLPGNGNGLSVGTLPVPDWAEVSAQLEEILPETEFRREMMETLARLTEEAENLSDWFMLVLQWLLDDKGLIFFNPLWPEFKAMAQECYISILNHHQEIRTALAQKTAEWEKAGGKAQIQPTGGEVNLFLSVPERRALLWEERGFHLRGREEFWPLDKVSELLEREPERFSPNVVTRPVVQDFLLPTLAYVAGPGEMNYWAQLGDVFRVLGQAMPVVYPRLSAVLITAGWKKIMDNERIELAEIYAGLSGRREQRLKEMDNLDIDGKFADLRRQIGEAYKMLDLLETLHPQAGEWIRQNQEKIEAQVQYLEKKMWQAQRKQSDGVLKHWTMVEEGILPNGAHQERVLTPLSFYVRYDRQWIGQLFELPLLPEFQEQSLILKGEG